MMSIFNCLKREVYADAINQHDRHVLIAFWNIGTFIHLGSKTNLELKHFRCPECINRTNQRLSIPIANALMPIHQ